MALTPPEADRTEHVEPMKLLTLASAAAAIALAAGCVQKYAVTESAPTAKLRYVTTTGDLTTLDRFDLAACPDLPAPQRVATTVDGNILIPGQVSPIQMVGTSGAAETRIREMLIEAGRPFIFKITASRDSTAYSRGYSCTVSGGFSPRAAVEYEISFESDENGCNNRIFRLSRGSNGQVVRTIEPTQRYIRSRNPQDFCKWRDTEVTVPSEIREALERPEASQSSPNPPPSAPAGDGSAAPMNDDFGSEIRDALKPAAK
jgi:hypothetical protein